MAGRIADIRSRLAKILEPKSYNRLIESVESVRQLRRLRFWQEALLDQARAAGVNIATVKEFLAVFDGATPLPVSNEPLTHELFLCLIEEFPYGGRKFDHTPPQWMADAWENDRIREALSAEMARTVTELGELAYDAEYLNYLSRSLPSARQVELYVYLRDMCRKETREDEFRPGFERAFPACVALLPPPLGGHSGANPD
jgi:hypothetical protein